MTTAVVVVVSGAAVSGVACHLDGDFVRPDVGSSTARRPNRRVRHETAVVAPVYCCHRCLNVTSCDHSCC